MHPPIKEKPKSCRGSFGERLRCRCAALFAGVAAALFGCGAYEARASAAAAAAAERPNVLLIVADDLGYGDLSCYGGKSIRTPVLDKLAAGGVRLTSFYAGATICTPSRMALLTGAYPRRVGWRGGVVGYGIAPQNGLSPKAVTIAEAFKGAGYKTALIGKWHLGDAPALSPARQGFETTYYINKSNNQTKKLWRGDKVIADPFDNRRLTELFTAEAIRFINENRNRPFLLYLPLTAPHFPAQAHPDWKGKSKNQAYGDVVEELDSRIGEILAALAGHDIDKNTIVVFLSDNGVEPGQKRWASSTPYRGLKWSSLEGGNRVPCVIRWPDKIPAGQISDAIVAAIDLFPTLAGACGVELPAKRSPMIDGANVLGTLIGRAGAEHPRKSLLFWHGWGTLQAIRMGPWKLYFDQIKELPGSKSGPVLIHLPSDPAEQTNLSAKHPERVAAMLAAAKKQLRAVVAPSMPLGGPPAKRKPTAEHGKWLK